MPKYPNIEVKLVGEDGNAFAILGRYQRAARTKLSLEEWKQFKQEATSGDYNKLLTTCMEWFETD